MPKRSRIARQRATAREKELVLLSQLIDRDEQIKEMIAEIRRLRIELEKYKARRNR